MFYIRLTKVSSTHRGLTLGTAATASRARPDLPLLATGYSIDGWLVTPPLLGHSILVWRLVRNGHVVPGLFSTSAVTEIAPGSGFTTLNAHYVYAPVTPVRWPRFDHLGPLEREEFRMWLRIHSSEQTPAPPDDGMHFHPGNYLAWKFPQPS